MEYTPLSPFMRPISRSHLQRVDPDPPNALSRPVNKWQLLRELSKAQAAFGVTERDLTVLQGLLSFFPDDALGGNAEMVVFPSNKAICERLNGMPCSTMRRHLARLVDVGLLRRRDSPNGKRYLRRDAESAVCFGFDLTALYQKADEIARAAEAVREAEGRLRRLREAVSLMRRDLMALAEYGVETRPALPLWADLCEAGADAARALRRKLSMEDLDRLRTDLSTWLDKARDAIDGAYSTEMITSDDRNGQHYHNSNTDLHVLEPALNQGMVAGGPTDLPAEVPEDSVEDTRPATRIPLHLVTESCPTIATYYQSPIRHWHQLYDAASQVRAAMGISPSAWEEAQRFMGPEQAAVVIVAMLERFADIRSPGGYLRALTAKAAEGQFSVGPMVMALVGRRSAA